MQNNKQNKTKEEQKKQKQNGNLEKEVNLKKLFSRRSFYLHFKIFFLPEKKSTSAEVVSVSGGLMLKKKILLGSSWVMTGSKCSSNSPELKWSCKTEVQVRGEPQVSASNRYENVAP